MMPSPIRIVLAPGTAGERVLLEWDDPVEAMPATPTSQRGAVETLLGAQWAALDALGNAASRLEVTSAIEYQDATAAALALLDEQTAALAFLSGVRIELANPYLGPTASHASRLLVRWDATVGTLAAMRCGIAASTPRRVRRSLSLAIGNADAALTPDTVPVGILPVEGIVSISVAPEDAAGIVAHSGQKWLRLAVRMPQEFTGDATAGWWDAAHLRHITIEHSFDLATWTPGQFIPAAGTTDVVASGWRTTWADSCMPQDAEELVSDMRLTWRRPDQYITWTYAQDLTGLTVNGAAVALPAYPYALPAQAGALQADLRAAGFTGATVTTDATAEVWEIVLPDVATTGYHHAPGGTVSPGHSYLNMFQDEAWTTTLPGAYENPRFGPALMPFTIYKRQFARGRCTRP